MLGGKITNQDEDEVEEELAALEAEVAKVSLPNVPATEPPTRVEGADISLPRIKEGTREEPAKQPERQAMLAS